MKVRVTKELYDQDHNPVMDDHGRQKEIGDAYLFGGIMHPPGAEIDMPDDVAERELRIHGQRQGQDGSTRHPHLESCALVKERQAIIQARKEQAGGFDPLAFQRKQQELEAQLRQSERQRQLVHEREEQLRGQDREMEAMRQAIKDVEQENRRREEELRKDAEAREERLRKEAEEMLARSRREADELRAALEEAQKAKPKRGSGEGATGAKGDTGAGG